MERVAKDETQLERRRRLAKEFYEKRSKKNVSRETEKDASESEVEVRGD